MSTAFVDIFRLTAIYMIRYRLKELIADKEFRERRVVTLGEISTATGIHRATLSKIANTAGYSTVTDNVDKLCSYFQCPVEALMQHVQDSKAEK